MIPDISTQETIIAESTPLGFGAIGIIRLSGPKALSFLAQVWKGQDFIQTQERHVYFGKITEPTSDTILDEVLLFYMKAPHSYTGEDMVEIQAHGNPLVLKKIIQVFIDLGACLARPGEFTQRAFLNGRMDLLQAEAVADLIHATSEKAAALAQRQMEGKSSDYIRVLRNELKVMRAQLEAMIDFPEDEDVQGLHYQEIENRSERLITQVTKLLQTYQEGRILKEGLRVGIVGRPNVGKSSLFNVLLREERSIVHDMPGTTRDIIEETIQFRGMAIRFLDTAGLRKSDNVVEAEGIRRAEAKLQDADLILWVLDQSRELSEEDQYVYERIQSTDKSADYLTTGLASTNRAVGTVLSDCQINNGPVSKKFLVVLNKSDLPSSLNIEGVRKIFSLEPSVSILSVSTKNEEGISALKDAMMGGVLKDASVSSDFVVSSTRHLHALQKGLEHLQFLRESSLKKASLELLVADLTPAINALGELTGEISTDEILGEIFSKFCIGK